MAKRKRDSRGRFVSKTAANEQKTPAPADGQPASKPTPEPPGQRDARGLFVKGNVIGKRGGRPSLAEQRRRLELLSQELDDQTWRQIARGIIYDALQGDLRAVEWLSKYLLPKHQDHSVWLAGIISGAETLPPGDPNESVTETYDRLFGSLDGDGANVVDGSSTPTHRKVAKKKRK